MRDVLDGHADQRGSMRAVLFLVNQCRLERSTEIPQQPAADVDPAAIMCQYYAEASSQGWEIHHSSVDLLAKQTCVSC